MITREEWVERFAGCTGLDVAQVEPLWYVESCDCGHDNCLGWKAEQMRCQAVGCDTKLAEAGVHVLCDEHLSELLDAEQQEPSA